LNATRLARNPPPMSSFFYATYHVAIFDTVNGITRTHQGWLINTAAPAGADLDAAIASAAFIALNALWGQSSNPWNFQTAYDRALRGIPDGPAKTAGVAWGKEVAEAVLAACLASGFNKPIPGFYSSTEPGKWRETPPGFRPPVLPHWG